MANPIITTSVVLARRVMRRHQGVRPHQGRPLWQLVVGELAYMARQLTRRR